MLLLHHSERADALVPALAAVLADPSADPFEAQVVAVPTRGVERWLAQRLSHHLGAAPGTAAGVCANVDFSSPARLVSAVLAAGGGLDPADDPWQPERLGWAVLEVLDECAGQPWSRALDRYLGRDGGADPGAPGDPLRSGRRLALARSLATRFASYDAERPQLAQAWAAGLDDDGAGEPVASDLTWQRMLWHRLRTRIGCPSPGERLAQAAAELVADPARIAALPARLSVFGPTRLPDSQLRVLHAVSRHRDVHLWLVHPSPALWARVCEQPPPPRRRRGQTGPARHPLLVSMGRDLVELQARLLPLAGRQLHHPVPRRAGPATLLTILQDRLNADAELTEAARPVLAADDRSIQVHACHGRPRQVEVLRELLVGLFADDPTLEPGDVVVMCPDVESVAALVAAAFGAAPDAGDEHPGRLLRVRIADRSPRQTNPQLALLDTLLTLADGRVTASQVLDLAAGPAVRRRFGFDEHDLERIRQWSVAAGVHWGEDLDRRARFGLERLRQGTWDAALDRLLLGSAMAEEDERYVASALPLDDVDSTDVDLAGRLAELLDRLGTVLGGLRGVRPAAAWLRDLRTALDLLADSAPADGWQGVAARQLLADAVPPDPVVQDGSEPLPRPGEVPLRLADVRALLADRLAGRPTRTGFRTGALTVASMEPMRAVPHRVVCLLGLDDGVFPRAGSQDGDDLLARDPCLGERDRRSEDRQLLLDAVTSAREHLVLLYSGADERTGAIRPPAVPVGELLDALDRTVATPDGLPAREHLVVRHPLQPVDPRNFRAAALRRPGPFSFDRVAHRAALAGRDARTAPPAFLPRLLPAPARPDAVDLADLIALLEHPARWFVRGRLRVVLAEERDEVDDRLPLELGARARWLTGERLLQARLAGVGPDRAHAAEWRRGLMPPRELGRAALESVLEEVVPIAVALEPHGRGRPAVVEIDAYLPAGGRVTGSVPGVHGDVVVRAGFARLGPAHRLRAWVQLLALVATDPSRPWRCVTVGRPATGRDGAGGRAGVATLRTPSSATSAQWLESLVRLREHACREPLPLPLRTAAAYARSRHAGDTQEQALNDAQTAWLPSGRAPDGSPGERADPYHELCWGPASTLVDVLGTPSAAERARWPEDSRLGVLARQVWEPLLEHEELGRG